MGKRLASQALEEHWKRQVEKIERVTPGALLGDDPEDVHQLRVALRRLRAVLALLKPYLSPATRKLNAELRWIAGIAGEVRDLDVLQERLWEVATERVPEETLSGWQVAIQVERAAALERLQVAFRSDRFESMWTLPPKLLKDPCLKEVSKKLIHKREKAWTRAIAKAREPSEFHLARKRAKQLRYALELLSPKRDRRLAVLAEIQELLGEHHDLYVLHESLEPAQAELKAFIRVRMEMLERSSLRRTEKLSER